MPRSLLLRTTWSIHWLHRNRTGSPLGSRATASNAEINSRSIRTASALSAGAAEAGRVCHDSLAGHRRSCHTPRAAMITTAAAGTSQRSRNSDHARGPDTTAGCAWCRILSGGLAAISRAMKSAGGRAGAIRRNSASKSSCLWSFTQESPACACAVPPERSGSAKRRCWRVSRALRQSL